MNKLKGGTEKQLHNQVHHDMHDSYVDEHVRNEAPGFWASEWVVDEKSRERTAGWCSDVVHVAVLVISTKDFIKLMFHKTLDLINLLQVHNVPDEKDNLNDAEDEHR